MSIELPTRLRILDAALDLFGARGVDAVSAGKRDILFPVCLVSPTVRLQIHLVRDVELCLPVLQRARGLVRAIPGAELRERPERRAVAQ